MQSNIQKYTHIFLSLVAFVLSSIITLQNRKQRDKNYLTSSSINIKHLHGSFLVPTHIQTRGWSFLLALIQKQATMEYMLKDHHYNKLPNSFLMEISLPTSHFLNFLYNTFGIHKLFVSQSIISLFLCHYIINSCSSCEHGGMPPQIKCLNANSKILLQIYYCNTPKKKTKR